MNVAKHKRITGVCFVEAVLVLLLLAGCNDKSTEPKVEEPTITDSPVYFVSSYLDTTVYQYTPSTRQLSAIPIPGTSWAGELAATPDGSLIFASDGYGEVYVISPSINEIVTTLNYPGYPAVTPDGKTLVLASDGVFFIDLPSLTLRHSIDSLYVGRPTISRDGKRMYAAHRGYDTGPIFVIDLSDSTYPASLHRVDYLLEYDLQIDRVLPSNDEKLWFISYGLDDTWTFAVLDPSADSVIFSRLLWRNRPAPNMAITPDGHRVFVAHPGNNYGGLTDVLPPPAEFMIYEVQTGEFWTKRVTGVNYELRPNQIIDTMPVGDMVVTADGKSLVCTHAGRPIVLVYDPRSLELVSTYFLELGTTPVFLTCPGE